MGYYYLRDYRLNSNDWFLNSISKVDGAENKPKNKFGYPGFNLGGPLLIPGTDFNKNRDKVFFFTGYEYYRQRLDTGTLRSYVPTEAMRNGDFSNTSSFNTLGNSFVSTVPNNLVNGVVPASQIDPNGQKLIALFPLPNVDPALAQGFNYAQNVELDQNMHQWLTRVDVNVTENTRVFARYNLQAEEQNFPVGLWWRNANQVPYPTEVTAPNRSHSSTASLTHIFGPTLTSESTFAATYIDFPNQFRDPSKVSRAALGYNVPGIYGNNGLDQIPSVTSWGNGPTLFNPGGFDPVLFATKWLISGAQNVTKVAGAHTLKMGAYYEWVNNSQPGNGDSNARLVPASWANGTSGNYFADLLTGTLAEYGEQSPNIVRDMAYNIFEGYVQDSWKVSNRLTVDLGLRLSHLGAWYERNGVGMAVWDPALYNASAPATDFPGITWTARDSSVPTSGIDIQPVFFAPRVGFAYDLSGSGNTLLRGGYGIFNFHDAQGPYSGFIDLPYGVTFTNTFNVPLSQVSNVDPNVNPAIGGTIQRDDDRSAAYPELEPDGPAAAAMALQPRDGVRGQQERPPAERRVGEHQLRAVRRDAERPDGRSEPVSAAGAVRRPNVVAAQPVPELQQPAGAVEPADVEVQHDRVVHVLEGARHSRRRPGGGGDSAWRPTRFRVRRARLRPHARVQHRLQLAAARRREQPAAQRLPRRLAVDGRLDLHQRRAAAAAGVDRRELRPDRDRRQRRHHQLRSPTVARPTSPSCPSSRATRRAGRPATRS